MNNDLLDDVIYLEGGTLLTIAYQQWHGDGFDHDAIGDLGELPEWSIVVGDLDQNGWKDIVVAGEYDHLEILYQDEGGFNHQRIPAPDLFAQSMNLVDINDDGWLDVFVCNDISYNEVWWNTGGQLMKDTTGLFHDIEEAYSAGNYGSEWADVDGDGDLDLYIAKCYADIGDPQHPLRRNRLYINQGNNTFEEEAEMRGVASGAQSWTGHFYDSDNDGDFDLLVTNHDRSAQLFINDGNGFFEEQTITSGLNITGPVIQSHTADFDLDGNRDVLIGGIPDYLYRGNGDNTYDLIDDVLGNYDVISAVVGDLNNDGRVDIYSNHLNLLNDPSSRSDRVFFNRSNGAFINVFLQDDQGGALTHDAVVKWYLKGKASASLVRAGQSYGVQNSFKLSIGLGNSEKLDSIEVIWHDGNKLKASDITPDSYIVFHKNGHILRQQDLGLPWRDTLCPGDRLLVGVPELGVEYSWNTGDVDNRILVRDEGYYQLTMIMEDASRIVLPGVSIYSDPVISAELRILQGDTVSCSGDSVVLAHEYRLPVLWDSGDTSIELRPIRTGWYGGVVQTKCGIQETDSIYIRMLEAGEFDIWENPVVRSGESTNVVTSEAVNWYSDSLTQKRSSYGDTLHLPTVENDTTVFAAPVRKHLYPEKVIGKSSVDASQPYHSENLNGTMLFTVQRPCQLKSVDVRTDTRGRRVFFLLRENHTGFDTFSMNLDTGWNTVPLEFDLHPDDGINRLTTLEAVNRQVLGTRSPRLMSCDSNVQYPYEYSGVLRIVVAQYGHKVYNYFYNWHVVPDPLECEGERRPIQILVDDVNTTTATFTDPEISIMPNPSAGPFSIQSNDKINSLIFYDMMGNRLEPVHYRRSYDGANWNYHVTLKENGVIIMKVDGKITKLLVRI